MAQYFNPKLRVHVTKSARVLDGMQSDSTGGWVDNGNAELPINEGNLIITEEGGEMFFDLEDKRVQVSPVWKELT